MAKLVEPNAVEVFEMIDAALKYDPSATKGKEGVYEFHLKGDDGGTCQMSSDEEGPGAIEGTEKDPQCTLEMNTDDFRSLVAGTQNPTTAFMGGKRKVKGNMGLALKLQTVLNSFSF